MRRHLPDPALTAGGPHEALRDTIERHRRERSDRTMAVLSATGHVALATFEGGRLAQIAYRTRCGDAAIASLASDGALTTSSSARPRAPSAWHARHADEPVCSEHPEKAFEREPGAEVLEAWALGITAEPGTAPRGTATRAERSAGTVVRAPPDADTGDEDADLGIVEHLDHTRQGRLYAAESLETAAPFGWLERTGAGVRHSYWSDGAQKRARIEAPELARILAIDTRAAQATVLTDAPGGSALGDIGPDLDTGEAERAIAAILRALVRLHVRGLCHAGVSPRTVRIGPQGTRLEGAALPRDTPAGHALRACGLDGPDIIVNERITEQGDLYALGATIVEAFTGTAPAPLAVLLFEPAMSAQLESALAQIATRSEPLARIAATTLDPHSAWREHPAITLLRTAERAGLDARDGPKGSTARSARHGTETPRDADPGHDSENSDTDIDDQEVERLLERIARATLV